MENIDIIESVAARLALNNIDTDQINRPGFENTQIIIAGSNFGCGSSREHAVWGLMQFGIRAVISESFGEIFYSNCFNNGLLAACVSHRDSERLLERLSDDVPVRLRVSVTERTISLPTGDVLPK